MWVDQTGESSTNGIANEYYGEPTYHQAPRGVRFGVGMSF